MTKTNTNLTKGTWFGKYTATSIAAKFLEHSAQQVTHAYRHRKKKVKYIFTEEKT